MQRKIRFPRQSCCRKSIADWAVALRLVPAPSVIAMDEPELRVSAPRFAVNECRTVRCQGNCAAAAKRRAVERLGIVQTATACELERPLLSVRELLELTMFVNG